MDPIPQTTHDAAFEHPRVNFLDKSTQTDTDPRSSPPTSSSSPAGTLDLFSLSFALAEVCFSCLLVLISGLVRLLEQVIHATRIQLAFPKFLAEWNTRVWNQLFIPASLLVFFAQVGALFKSLELQLFKFTPRSEY
jgi:hypothetical protein